jgi:prepilin-type N-terminal cleavage/methylation domain-containing protein/prepilin-type processing-associated H-X9-DG protein
MRRAFSLIELLVAAAVILLLISIVLPALARARHQGKRAVCLANLHQVGLATAMYLDDSRDCFWRYYWKRPGGIRWWFGYEPGGPATGQRNRPLDKMQGVLAPYLRSVDDGLQCPEFPYDSACYFPKFAARSASYGFNLLLGPSNERLPTQRRADYAGRTASVFVFADGAHFDFSPGMNEGHYIEYSADLASAARGGGFGHFRHARRAMVLFIDGHAEPQPLRGPAFVKSCGGPAGNLTTPAGGNGIYGF